MRIINPTEPPDYVAEYLEAKQAADQAQERLKKAQKRVLEQMESDKRKQMMWTDHQGRTNTVTYVRNSRVSIDEVGLRKALTAKVFDKYTKKVLDKPKMEQAMTTGDVDPTVVAKYATETPSSPYLKYTMREEDSRWKEDK